MADLMSSLPEQEPPNRWIVRLHFPKTGLVEFWERDDANDVGGRVRWLYDVDAVTYVQLRGRAGTAIGGSNASLYRPDSPQGVDRGWLVGELEWIRECYTARALAYQAIPGERMGGGSRLWLRAQAELLRLQGARLVPLACVPEPDWDGIWEAAKGSTGGGEPA